MDWIDLSQDRDKWQALANMVMNFRIPENKGIPWLALVASPGLSSMELVS
jgi:hypothetical protein